ncbi:phospho-N-acetylmuramoyl-pentapeptide-transferase [Natranaerofaba carboxydovora]|uniref:phospho-N-acetylmuramoyl-pentapeptide- transferase n=1 Tax=Natranaerofaba carboxydovora TaxID=2742683 RepID=UPI001F1405E0|nr:phospho-N-acetylmuramoyl-pentapeptide-transferase [Natranaerofaba carboxydovora]UMZ73255.1 Phospho-N-acetylmuramoyl-pentapeptide-transferase [Natranaerofaba carboxydovora]
MDLIYILIIVSFIISIALTPLLIPLLTRLKFGQQIRNLGPRRHMEKSGTPTMGGLVFLLASVISLIILVPIEEFSGVAILIFVTIAMGLIGFVDDYIKVVKKQSLGLRARQKIIGQLLVVAIFGFYLLSIDHSTKLFIPFTDITIEIGFFYFLLVAMMILGTANAVNLTDGLDGLAGGIVIIGLTAYIIVAHMMGLNNIAYFGSSLMGGVAGFLIFNLHPAKIFMGDVGSLSLGSALAVMAILTKTELTLIIVGIVLITETVSVILQVLFYQLTGKRILLMSPLHHHFELSGWSEWKVVTTFWLVSLIAAFVGVISINNIVS